MPIGQQHFWQVEQLNIDGKTEPYLPTSVPEHLRNSLNLEQIITLCTTIAVSAHYSNHRDKLGYITDLATAYASNKGINPEHNTKIKNPFVIFKLARMWLTQIDSQITNGSRNDLVLIEVRKILSYKIFNAFKPNDTKKWLSLFKAKNTRPILISWMRMRFREAELLDRAGKSNEAWEILDELVKFDNFISSKLNYLEPVIFSGRTARRFIKCVYGDPLVEPRRKITKEISDTARLLMEVNIARLRRFSGVDRIGVLVDLARRHAQERDYKKAIGYITKANIRIRNAPVSDIGKSELLVCLASIRILCAINNPELSKTAKTKFLAKAGENAKRILQLNKRAKSNLLEAKGRFILATSDFHRAKGKSTLSESYIIKLTRHVDELNECLENLKRDKDTRYTKEIRKLIGQIEHIDK